MGLLRPAGVNAEVIQWRAWNTTALAAVIFALVWPFSGFAIGRPLAGLRGDPDRHYEAARVDGASTVRMYARVIIPQLRASAVSASVVLMVFALRAFDFIYALRGVTDGGEHGDLATMSVSGRVRQRPWAYGSASISCFSLAPSRIVVPY